MLNEFFRQRRNSRRKSREIYPDEILIDSHNLPKYDTGQFEGRLDKPIRRGTLYSVVGIFLLMTLVFLIQAGKMQIVKGAEYRSKGENNILRPVPLFAGRGVIFDRNGQLLAWNSPAEIVADSNSSTTLSLTSASSSLSVSVPAKADDSVARRDYATSTGLSHILGYVQYPSKDKNGFYYREDFEGVSGAEKIFNEKLTGTAGQRLIEVDARGKIITENVVEPPIQGEDVTLSIDSRLQSALHHNIKDIAERVGFAGGAGVIMDVRSGELLALTSYPEYSSQIMSDRNSPLQVTALLTDSRLPFLNRAVDGLYTPGSIVKPYLALGAQNEGVIDAATVIHTTGSISIPNPYDSTKSTLFRDWKNHGAVDMRRAISVSSDVYFYAVGGGYKDQKGLGILKIDKYLQLFGLGTTTTDGSKSTLMTKAGTIPTPEWKKKTFNEDWYLGDTYHTAIGQYGFQVTLVQMVRALAAVANNGTMITPTIIKGQPAHIESVVSAPAKYYQVVQEGMRQSVQSGTSVALNVPYAKIAGKSGTAELGVSKDKVNSWITGFWPYENPKYAFVVMLEKGSVHNLIGAAAAMRQQLDWMDKNTPEYFK